MLVYVDDLLITGSDPDLDTKQVLHKHFKIKYLGMLRYFLGIEFCRSNTGIVMNQRKYALQLIFEAGLAGAKLSFIPLQCNVKLTSATYDTSTNDMLFPDVRRCQRRVEKLLYLTNIRPDILMLFRP